MQEFETLGDEAIHAERATRRAFEAAEQQRRAVKRDDRRDELRDSYDTMVDAARTAWIEAFERRWTLA
jgi:ribosomal protein L28